MKVILAEKLGFCFGVNRALEMTKSAILAAETSKENISMLGPLIHNKAVTGELEDHGIEVAGTLDDISCGTLIIRAHGATKETIEAARQKNLTIVNATCPLVQRVQRAAASLVKDGYRVFLAGDKGHAEVRSIVSAARGEVTVVATPEEILQENPAGKTGLLFQTTRDPDTAKDFFTALFGTCSEVRVINTICNATTERQRAIKELAPKVDCFVVVGDTNSANTARLTKIAKKLNDKTVQVESAAELSPEFFAGCKVAGISAGASTPDWLINEVKSFLEKL